MSRPLKRISERFDAVADELQTVAKVGTVAFVLISIVAVTALIVTIGVISNAR